MMPEKIVYLPTSVLCEMNDDGIFIMNRFFGQSEEEHRREVLTMHCMVVEGWRAWAALRRTSPEYTDQATELAYKINAVERHAWPETKAIAKGRTFMPHDLFTMADKLRGRILEELEKKPAEQPKAPIVEKLHLSKEVCMADCKILKELETYHPTTINRMLTDKYGAMPAQAAMRHYFPESTWSN